MAFRAMLLWCLLRVRAMMTADENAMATALPLFTKTFSAIGCACEPGMHRERERERKCVCVCVCVCVCALHSLTVNSSLSSRVLSLPPATPCFAADAPAPHELVVSNSPYHSDTSKAAIVFPFNGWGFERLCTTQRCTRHTVSLLSSPTLGFVCVRARSWACVCACVCLCVCIPPPLSFSPPPFSLSLSLCAVSYVGCSVNAAAPAETDSAHLSLATSIMTTFLHREIRYHRRLAHTHTHALRQTHAHSHALLVLRCMAGRRAVLMAPAVPTTAEAFAT